MPLNKVLKGMTDLTNAEWQAQITEDSEAVIVDVRTQEEVDEGYIPQSLHMDIYNPMAFMEFVNGLDKSKNYYVYCRSGGRSAQACAVMESVGISTTYNLVGGISEYTGDINQ